MMLQTPKLSNGKTGLPLIRFHGMSLEALGAQRAAAVVRGRDDVYYLAGAASHLCTNCISLQQATPALLAMSAVLLHQ